ncbi:hypothetical protein GC207_00035 [bacterium]|nr:hypothetical protein [bacterium]
MQSKSMNNSNRSFGTESGVNADSSMRSFDILAPNAPINEAVIEESQRTKMIWKYVELLGYQMGIFSPSEQNFD